MSRPTVPNIQNQTSGWDAVVNNLKDVALNGPFPMVVATSVAALTTNFPANAYDYCFAIVNHGTYGHSLYISDGTSWRHYSTFHKTPHRTISGATTAAATDGIIEATGVGSFTLTLPTAAAKKGETLIVKNSAAASITLAGNGAETIDGAATQTLSPGDAVRLYSTGTYWLRV